MYLIVGMASLGALTGFFVAWSASPIAQIALPLIFGLIGGASGFSVTKMDVTEPANVSKLKLLGQTLAAFSLACIVGVVVGIAVKPRLIAFNNPQHNVGLTENKTPETIIEYIVLRKKLELVGASEDEIAHLLALVESTGMDSFKAAIAKLDSAMGLLASQSGTRLSSDKLQPLVIPFSPDKRDSPGPQH